MRLRKIKAGVAKSKSATPTFFKVHLTYLGTLPETISVSALQHYDRCQQDKQDY